MSTDTDVLSAGFRPPTGRRSFRVRVGQRWRAKQGRLNLLANRLRRLVPDYGQQQTSEIPFVIGVQRLLADLFGRHFEYRKRRPGKAPEGTSSSSKSAMDQN